ncbi:hypothetical protein [Roseomonas sp. WA12]
MRILTPGRTAQFFPDQEVGLVNIRTGILEDVLTVSAVLPSGDVAVRGWKGLFSPNGLELRQPDGTPAATRHSTCEVISLQGHILARLPAAPPRTRAARRLSPRWLIRAATAEDRAFLIARDNDLQLMRMIAHRLTRAARSAEPLPRAALLEIAKLADQLVDPR